MLREAEKRTAPGGYWQIVSKAYREAAMFVMDQLPDRYADCCEQAALEPNVANGQSLHFQGDFCRLQSGEGWIVSTMIVGKCCLAALSSVVLPNIRPATVGKYRRRPRSVTGPLDLPCCMAHQRSTGLSNTGQRLSSHV